MKTLAILIPTYNRSSHLKQNITQLESMIKGLNLLERVNILISNNNSPDSTLSVLSQFKLPNLTVYNQETNIGLESNALFCLSKSNSDYIMFLGDDDYLSEKYLNKVLGAIDAIEDLSLIVPSCQSIDIDGNRLAAGRDLGEPNCHFRGSIDAAIFFASKGCQMSGVVHKRIGLLDSYQNDKASNIYPFVYFTTYSALTGQSVHITENPILITQPGQENKTWNYGDDGLLDEIFNNFKSLNLITESERYKLESKVLKDHPWRWIYAIKNNPLRFMLAIFRSQNTSFYNKAIFPFRVLRYGLAKVEKMLTLNKHSK